MKFGRGSRSADKKGIEKYHIERVAFSCQNIAEKNVLFVKTFVNFIEILF